MSEPTTSTLQLPDVDLAYDVAGPLPPADGHPVLLMIGQPMCADGFVALAQQFPDRTVVTYDPRGLGRSTSRRDGRTDQNPVDQTSDLHALVAHLGAGPVDVFASSGGAVTALEWAATHPEDLRTVLAHEPPSIWALPDAEAADQAFQAVGRAYADSGFGAGMARFIGLVSWQGEFTADYLEAPAPDPAMFGLPAADDGHRDDPLLSERSATVVRHRFDLDAIRSAPTRVVLGVGEETGESVTARTSRALAELLGTEPVMFPSHHGGFAAEGGPMGGRPVEFAATLRSVLAD